MKIALSVPSGFHARELLVPLKSHFESDQDITKVLCISPGAAHAQKIFPNYTPPKFSFVVNAKSASAYQDFFTRERPDIVVTNTNGLDYRDIPILRAAKALNLKTLTFIASWDNVWKIARIKEQQKPYTNADYFIVWNTMMRDHLAHIFPEIEPSHIQVIGSPRFDFFQHTDAIPTKKELFDYLNISPDDGKLIHFATTELYPMEYIIKTIAQAAQQQKLNYPVHLYASVHPGGDMKRHQHYAKKYHVTTRYSFGRQDSAPDPSFKYNPTKKEIYMLIALFKHADLLINQSSTVAIESFAGDTPVINVKYGRRFDWWRWYRSRVYGDFQEHYKDILIDQPTKVVTSPQELVTATNTYLTNPALDQANRQKNLARIITITDGTASQKVLDHIKQRVRV